MSCFGSDSSLLLQTLLLNCDGAKKRKFEYGTGPAFAERKVNKRIRNGEPQLNAVDLILLDPLESELNVTIELDVTEIDPEPVKIVLDPELVESRLADLCAKCPNFDIRSSFVTLLKKYQNSNNILPWTAKYAPKCSAELLGNSDTVITLRNWLQDWKLFVEKNLAIEAPTKLSHSDKKRLKKEKTTKNREKRGRSSSVSDCASEEFQLPPPEEMPLASYMLYGKSGVGKTAAVYALAEELGFSILEINPASSKDSRQILVQFLEATQSHRIAKSNPVGMANFFKAKQKEVISKPNTLILIDDADVIPDGEESFVAGLEQMLKLTKRPIIFTVSGSSKSRIIDLDLEVGDVEFFPPSSVDVACYTCLAGLAESVDLDYSSVINSVLKSNGDLRAALNQAEFWKSHFSKAPVKPIEIPKAIQNNNMEILIIQQNASNSAILSHLVAIDLDPSLSNNEIICEPIPDGFVLPEVVDVINSLVQTVDSNTITPPTRYELETSELTSEIATQETSDSGYSSSGLSVAVAPKPLAVNPANLKQLWQFLETKSITSNLLSHEPLDNDFKFWRNSPIPGTSECELEDPLTFFDRSTSSERRSDYISTSINEFFNTGMRNIADTFALDGCVLYQHLSPQLGEKTVKTGRLLMYRYAQFCPKLHVHASKFGPDYWTFIRSMAYSEHNRQRVQEQAKRRRLRFYHYLANDRVYFSQELLNQIAYQIGKAEPEIKSDYLNI